jgi:hypothetical protein
MDNDQNAKKNVSQNTDHRQPQVQEELDSSERASETPNLTPSSSSSYNYSRHQIVQMQRLVGNRATQKLLRKPQEPDEIQQPSHEATLDFPWLAGKGSRTVAPPADINRASGHESQIQRKQVEVAGGVFDDKGHPDGYITYEDVEGGYLLRGAQMSGLSFTPKMDVKNASGDAATEVSLVQTTNSDIHDTSNPEAEDQPESMLDERRTEAGSAVDQQMYLLPTAGELSDKGIQAKTKWKGAELAAAIQEVESGYVDHSFPDGSFTYNLYKDGRTKWSVKLAAFRKSFADGGNWDSTHDARKTPVMTFKSDMEKLIGNESIGMTKVLASYSKSAQMTTEELTQQGWPTEWIDGRATIPGRVEETITRVQKIIAIVDEMIAEIDADLKEKQFENSKVNLDPRYHEERTDEGDAFSPRAKSDDNPAFSGTTGWPATRAKGDDAWEGEAMLRDQPSHKIPEGHELEGKEHFETAAMADGNKFVGSVKWGWRINGLDPVLDPPEIEVVSYGEASDEFYEAAAMWNQMLVTDPRDSEIQYTTLQLPTKPIVMPTLHTDSKIGQFWTKLRELGNRSIDPLLMFFDTDTGLSKVEAKEILTSTAWKELSAMAKGLDENERRKLGVPKPDDMGTIETRLGMLKMMGRSEDI